MKRLLIIDDEREIAELLHIFFSTIGLETEICLNGRAALNALEADDFWAVFCDFTLTDMSGASVYRELKTRRYELVKRFVLMTGHMLDDEVDSFLRSEGIRVLRKPFRLEDVQSLINELQEG